MHRVTFSFHSASVRLILGMDKLIQSSQLLNTTTKPALRYFHQATNSRSCFASKLENGGRRVAPSSPRIWTAPGPTLLRPFIAGLMS